MIITSIKMGSSEDRNVTVSRKYQNMAEKKAWGFLRTTVEICHFHRYYVH